MEHSKQKIFCAFCKTDLLTEGINLVKICLCGKSLIDSEGRYLTINMLFGNNDIKYMLIYNNLTQLTYLVEYFDFNKDFILSKPHWVNSGKRFCVKFDIRNKNINELEKFVSKILRRQNCI